MADEKYTVLVDDNFHYMDADERYTEGEYDTPEEALAACRRIVRESLEGLYEPGITAEKLMAQYCLFGDDPFVRSSEVKFQGRVYAREIAQEVIDRKKENTKESD